MPRKNPDCIEFVGYKDKNGYGIKSYQNKNYRAHRLVYMQTYGEIPEGLFVCHSCDNPSCVNPKHLFLGTPKDNTLDMIQKGRYVRMTGQRNGRSTTNRNKQHAA
jgi:hypothetical protein